MNRSYLEGRKQVLQERTQPELRRPEELWSVQEKSSGLWTRSGLNGVEEGERRATNLVRELECWVPTGGGWVLTVGSLGGGPRSDLSSGETCVAVKNGLF